MEVKSDMAVDVTVIKRIEVKQKYFLITSKHPFEMEVTGPSTVRFYTRLVFSDPSIKSGRYSLILEEDTVRQKIVSKSTTISKTSRWNGFRLGKWRSFVVEVPPGKHTYRIHLFDAPFDSVLIRPVILEYNLWNETPPVSTSSQLIAVENNSPVRYWISKDGRFQFQVDGASKARIYMRYNFHENESEPQSFDVIVYIDSNPVVEKSFTVMKSRAVYYQDRADLTPSVRKAVWIDVPPGAHKITVETSRNVAVRFLTNKK